MVPPNHLPHSKVAILDCLVWLDIRIGTLPCSEDGNEKHSPKCWSTFHLLFPAVKPFISHNFIVKYYYYTHTIDKFEQMTKILCCGPFKLYSFLQGVYRTFQTLESLTFERGLRKPYKALVLEMEPYKMKKKLSRQATNFFLLSHKFFFCQVTFFCWVTIFFYCATNIFFVTQPNKCKHYNLTEP